MTNTTRFEPIIGTTGTGKTFLAGLGLGVKQPKSHDVILNDALQAFTDAQAKLDQATATIEAQVEEHRQQAEFHQNKATQAGESLSRLERVKSRFANLLA